MVTTFPMISLIPAQRTAAACAAVPATARLRVPAVTGAAARPASWLVEDVRTAAAAKHMTNDALGSPPRGAPV